MSSLLKQTYSNWRAMIVFDNPTDNGPVLARKITDKRFSFLINSERKGLCHNMYFSIKFAASLLKPTDNTVFAFLDADDWLAPEALQYVEHAYRKKPDILVTHGSYIKLSKGKKTKISGPYPKKGNVRKLPWRGSHFKTCKWEVLKDIRDDWFQDSKGNWLDAASDLALMWGVIDICGLRRVHHIPQVTYYWNDHMTKDKARKQKRCEAIQRAK